MGLGSAVMNVLSGDWMFKSAQPQQVVRVMSDVYERTQGVNAPSSQEDYLKMYGEVGWVYICANKIAKKAAAADFILYNAGTADEAEITEHVLLDTLRAPNNMFSEYQLWYYTHLHMNLAGEAFWYVSPNIAGGPGQIFPLIPDRMKVVPGEKDLIQGYIYDVNGQIVAFEPQEIIHFFYPNPDPDEFFRGATPLSALSYALGTYINSELWNYQFFKNGATPPGYLKTDFDLDEKEMNRLRRLWEKQHKGQKNWWKIAVASNGLEYVGISPTHKDMEFVVQMQNARDIILAAYGMPKSLVGLVEDVNKANGFQDEMNFATYTIDPELKIISSTLNAFYLPLMDEKLRCKFDNVIPRDRQQTLNEHKLYLSTGTMTINEVRQEKKLPKVDWGDVPIMPVNMVPFGQTVLGDQSVPPDGQAPEEMPEEEPDGQSPDEGTPPESNPEPPADEGKSGRASNEAVEVAKKVRGAHVDAMKTFADSLIAAKETT